jgi:2-polyprenyl-3-methyl-5-hydroxy-6-metoxy-1,4-benzoquinol methylase
MAQLEQRADQAIQQLRARRQHLAAQQGGSLRLREQLDRLTRTDTLEYLDRPDHSVAEKKREVQALHRYNRLFFVYHGFLHILAPLIQEVAQRSGRAARLLELAAGSGQFTLALARLAHKRRFPVEVTGSDVVSAYVREGNARARRTRLPVTFREINAFDMQELYEGEFDLVFIGSSLHHFRPGQLARMIAQSVRVAGTAFVGIDGRRSLLFLGLVPVATLLLGNRYLLHDSVITARRLYSEPELELLAQIAAPGRPVQVRAGARGTSVLTIRTQLPDPR